MTDFQVLLDSKIKELKYNYYFLLKKGIYLKINDIIELQTPRIEKTLQQLSQLKGRNQNQENFISENGWVVFKNIPNAIIVDVLSKITIFYHNVSTLFYKTRNALVSSTTEAQLNAIDTNINIFNSIPQVLNGKFTISLTIPQIDIETNEILPITLTNNQNLLNQYLSK